MPPPDGDSQTLLLSDSIASRDSDDTAVLDSPMWGRTATDVEPPLRIRMPQLERRVPVPHSHTSATTRLSATTAKQRVVTARCVHALADRRFETGVLLRLASPIIRREFVKITEHSRCGTHMQCVVGFGEMYAQAKKQLTGGALRVINAAAFPFIFRPLFNGEVTFRCV